MRNQRGCAISGSVVCAVLSGSHCHELNLASSGLNREKAWAAIRGLMNLSAGPMISMVLAERPTLPR